MNDIIIVSYDGSFPKYYNKFLSNTDFDTYFTTECCVKNVSSDQCTYCLKCDVILLTPNFLKHCLLCNNCHYKHNIFVIIVIHVIM